MPARTPPKGRPTAGRRDRQVAQRRSRSRSTTKKFIWTVLAVALLAAVLILGTGTGSGDGLGVQGVVLGPGLVLLRSRRARPAPPADRW